jgi:hypothetical protein
MSAAGQPLALPARAVSAPPSRAARAVARTVSYAALFQAPLTLEALHRSLMDERLDPEALGEALAEPWVRERVEVSDGLVHPRGRSEWIALRRRRRLHTRALLRRHRRALELLARCPFLRLVGLSGACAHDNASDDDVDLFLVARAGRAWVVYLAAIVLGRLLGVRRTLCVNYVVDESELEVPDHDVFTACELVGLRPLAGRDAYCRFVQANGWVARLFPNFFFDRHAADAHGVPPAGAPSWVERALDLGPAPALERLSRWALGARLRRKAAGAPGLRLAAGRLKLHLLDHREPLLAAWREAEAAAGGEERP